MSKSTTSFVASAHWPYYDQRIHGEVLYDKASHTHGRAGPDGKIQPTQNAIAAAYTAQYNPDGSKKR